MVSLVFLVVEKLFTTKDTKDTKRLGNDLLMIKEDYATIPHSKSCWAADERGF